MIPHVRERSVKVRSPHGTPRGKLCGLSGLSLCGLWQEMGGGSAGVRSEGGRGPPLQCALSEFKELSKPQ